MSSEAGVASVENLKFRCTHAKERLEGYIAEVI